MLAAVLLAASLGLSSSQSDQIDALAADVMRDNNISALSLGIARNGEPLLVRGYGVANHDAQSEADGDTVYGIGSLTKQFTAALVLAAIENGKLQPAQTENGATVVQLLAQTSGLPNYTEPGVSLDDALREPPQFTPGTQWAYSNTNYYVLGKLLERATGASYADLLQTTVLTPLQLTATTADLPSGPHAAIGYEYNDGGYIPVETSDDEETLLYAAAGVSSSVNDMLKWLDALQHGKIVSASDYQMMTTTSRLSDGQPTNYGYGFYIHNWYGWRTAEHPGYIDGFSADDAIVTDDGLEIVVLCNATNVALEPLTKSIVATLEPARDRALVASIGTPGFNEDPKITSDVRATVESISNGSIDRTKLTPALNVTFNNAQLRIARALFQDVGKLRQVEFVEHLVKDGVSYEKYRVTFAVQQFWVTVSYKGSKLNTLSIEPDNE